MLLNLLRAVFRISSGLQLILGFFFLVEFSSRLPPIAAIHVIENLHAAFELFQVRSGEGLKPLHRYGPQQGRVKLLASRYDKLLTYAEVRKGNLKAGKIRPRMSQSRRSPRLLTCSHVLLQLVNLKLRGNLASKILTRTLTSKLSYLRYSSIFTRKSDHNLCKHLSKRSRIRSLEFLEMASTFLEPLSRRCLHRRQRILVILIQKAAVLKTLFVCQESRWTTFGPSCASYIRCEFSSYGTLYKHLSRVFNMIKYFSIDQTPVEDFKFDEWVGVLHLATKWFFKEVLVFLCSHRFFFFCLDVHLN